MARYLAEKFNGVFVPEYAREYVNSIGRHYEYNDIEIIARKQIQQYNEQKSEPAIVFFDTWLIIAKVWFDWVYGKVPVFVEEGIKSCPFDLYLLMKPDIPWEADPARENGGENRQKLFDRYKKELDYYGCRYVEIGGEGEARFINAENEISRLMK